MRKFDTVVYLLIPATTWVQLLHTEQLETVHLDT